MKKNIITLITTLIIGGILYYFFLPALNIHSMGFWIFLVILITIFILTKLTLSMDINGRISRIAKSNAVLVSAIALVFIMIMLINFVLSPLFNSKSYSKRIIINEDEDFINDIAQVDFDAIPLLDKESSQKLGDRVMGQMPELVSQFYVSDLYTQINYNNQIVRVTPLEYDGIIKYFTNKKDGVKGYIIVNSVTGVSTLTKLDKGMKYMDSALFSEDLNRKLRFTYPTKIFGEYTFEIDNESNPYWIVPCLKYSGVELKRDVEGVIILDPITGKSDYYKVSDVPTWVDHVYSSDMIIEQVNDWGKYKNGFINSIFGQKNVVKTTTGYNYTVMNDDVYLYTGITSVASDESNIGFILTNMRTKETNYYPVSGAEEYSAMASAEGQVQQMKYTASFPLLINLNNRPTYLISLKDDAGLVKMYAFVDVVDYQKVVVTDASKGIKKASLNYLDEITDENDTSNLIEKDITIANFTTAIIDGNTYYYITDTENKLYIASIKANKNKLPFIKINDVISISYKQNTEIIEITSIK
ncbi:MAG: CvpA family protein [Bacilli bacterium]|nr:CvpA family protein [Bacilli bacterium]